MWHFFQRTERLCLIDDYVAGALAAGEIALDYQERRPEGMLVLLIDFPEDHARNVPELVFQRDKHHLAVGSLPADDQPGGRHRGAVAQLFDVLTGAETAPMKSGAQLCHDMPGGAKAKHA